MATTHELLISARKAIENRKQWTQFSRGGDGRPRCALGALDVATGNLVWNDDAPVSALANAVRSLGFHNDRILGKCDGPSGGDTWLVANYNNTHEHADVLAIFDRAIAAATPRSTDISIFKEMLTPTARELVSVTSTK